MTAPGASARPYDGTRRRQRAEETRDRIVAAGSELVHAGSVRDWRRMTVRAVAGRAGVSERTVYRHFGDERGLADAVMHRLEEEAGIRLVGMGLGEVATVAAQIFEHVATYPPRPRAALDPTLVDAGRRQKEALTAAVTAAAGAWPDPVRVRTAAVLDVLWSVAAYERLVGDWQLDADEAVRAATWVIGLVDEAVRAGRGPT